jgi:hypothetical protein
MATGRFHFGPRPIPIRQTLAPGKFDHQTDLYRASEGQTDVDLTDFGISES